MTTATTCLLVWHFVVLSVISKVSADRPSTFLIEQGCQTLPYWNAHMTNFESALISHLPESSSTPVVVKGSMKLQLNRNPLEFLPTDEYVCKVGFVASRPDFRVMLSWLFFGIGEDRNSEDWINVLDYESNFELSGPMWGAQGQSIGGRRPPPTQDCHSIGRGLSLAYRGRPYNDAFTVILTEFEDVKMVDKTCENRTMYRCNGDWPICIAPELACNGEKNCGDRNYSEEGQCTKTTAGSFSSDASHKMPVGLIGALVAVLITGLIFLLMALACFIWKKKRRSNLNWHGTFSTTRSTEVHEDNVVRPVHGDNVARPVHGIDALSRSYKLRQQNEYSSLPLSDASHNNAVSNTHTEESYFSAVPAVRSHLNNGHVIGYSHQQRMPYDNADHLPHEHNGETSHPCPHAPRLQARRSNDNSVRYHHARQAEDDAEEMPPLRNTDQYLYYLDDLGLANRGSDSPVYAEIDHDR